MTKFQPACSGPPAKHLPVFHSCLGFQGQPGQMKERTAAGEPFPPSPLSLPDPHHQGRAFPPSLCFAFSLSFVSAPLCLSYLSSLTFNPSSVLIPSPSPSLPPGSCLSHLPAPASWATPGGCHGPAECWTPSEVAEPWSPTPFPLLSGGFGGDLKEGREQGRGRQP